MPDIPSHHPADTSRELHALRVEVRDLGEQVRGLVEAWETARGIVRLMRALAYISTTAAGIWALVGIARGAK